MTAVAGSPPYRATRRVDLLSRRITHPGHHLIVSSFPKKPLASLPSKRGTLLVRFYMPPA